MMQHRLWEGLREYRWVLRMLLGVAAIIGVYLISETIEYFESAEQVGLLGMAIGGESLLWLWAVDLYDSFSDGVLNWVTLVLLEVVIFHFMRRALQIVLQRQREAATTFRPFFHAQIRMVKVSLLAFFVESMVLGLGEGLFPSGIAWVWSIFFRSLFLGYVIADNYSEQFGLAIDQSRRYLARQYLGICLGLGFPLLLMLEVPLIGTILGPLVTSVTAAIVLREKSDLHIIGYQMSAREQQRAAKKAAKAARKAARKKS